MSADTLADDRPRQILVVEDNEDARQGLARCLELGGYEVKAVGDGASALERLRQGEPPDFLLIDLQLPDIDGDELARLARLLVPNARLALISGWVTDRQVEGLASPPPVDWVFAKPIDIRRLLETLRQADLDPVISDRG